MKMIYGGTPVNSLKVRHYETNTNDATTVPSAVQAGLTYYANGRKEIGTGKSFEFASYGEFLTNEMDYIPSDINVILVSSVDNPIRLVMTIDNIRNQNFMTPVEIGSAFIDNAYYPIFVSVDDNFISMTCEKTILLQVFYGKDNYV